MCYNEFIEIYIKRQAVTLFALQINLLLLGLRLFCLYYKYSSWYIELILALISITLLTKAQKKNIIYQFTVLWSNFNF
jgi:hypothetical protein